VSAGEFILAWYALGAGATLVGFWGWVVVSGRAPKMGEGRDDFGWHIAAEMVAGGLLLVAGVGMVAMPDARWPDILSAVGIGAVIYAITESAGHYLASGQRMMAAAVALGWVFTLPALVLRFVI
jgi:hypothetical protein